MFPHVHHERQGKVYDDRRSEGDEGCIDKEQPDAGSRYAELFAQSGANPESVALEKMLDPKC